MLMAVFGLFYIAESLWSCYCHWNGEWSGLGCVWSLGEPINLTLWHDFGCRKSVGSFLVCCGLPLVLREVGRPHTHSNHIPRLFWTPSVLGYIFIFCFWYIKMILLTLGKLYGGEKINGQSLHCSNPHISFWSCTKSSNNKNRCKNVSMNWRD